MKKVNPFYKTDRWLRKRAAILCRDEYQCRHCRRYGRVTPADTVHHILPFQDAPERRLDSENLISLCSACHNSMHDRDSGKLTAVGQAWVERTYPPTPPAQI